MVSVVTITPFGDRERETSLFLCLNSNNHSVTIMKSTCPQCEKLHSNPKFCSQSCSAAYNNKRRAPQGKGACKDCEKQISNARSRCRPCHSKWQTTRVLGDSVTLSEAVLRYEKHHPSSAFALVRTRARKVMEGHTCCQWCGYDKHVEIAHRTAISEFSGDTLLSTINDKNNLLALCRNCHWEHDKLGRRE